MGVRGKRAGTLLTSKKKRGAADPEQQLDQGQVPAEQQADHVEPPSNMTHDQFLIALGQQPKEELKRWDAKIEDLRTELKTAVSGRSTFLRTIKDEYGATAIPTLKDMVLMEDPAKEAGIQEEIERRLKIAKFLAIPLGTQFDWIADRTPSVDSAYDEGVSDGRQNKSPNYNKWAPTTAQREFYERGFERGCIERNELMAQGYRKPVPPPIGDAAATYTDAEPPPAAQEEWPEEGQPPKPQTPPEQEIVVS